MSTAYTTTDTDPGNGSGGFISVFDNKRKRADRYFNNFEYKSAIKLYSKLVKKGKADDEVKLRLAESYLKVNDPGNAEKWYSEVIHSDQITPQHQIQYAHTLLSNGKYEEARQVIDSYEFADSDYQSKAIINTLDKLEIFYADSMYYHVNSLKDDKPHYSDFSPTVYKKGIVFVSSRHDKGPKFKWDDTPFLDLYYTESDVASAKPFSKNLNSKYHEGPIAFYDDYSKVIFTRSNYLDNELGITDQGINNLQLYTASWDEDQNDWDNIKPIDFTIENYSYGHPTISTDNTKLYFISDMPGGFGDTDIYVSERNENGWGEPVNMGEVINTSENEMYPFIDDENNLYFASNGHGGLGGLDVFQISLERALDLRNMGYPLNTTADDFGFSLTPSGDIAYISSNREGPDNIYQIDIKAPDLEIILADNSVNSEIPEIRDRIEPLATSELSTLPEFEEPKDYQDLSTINASIIDENNEVLKNANLKLLVNGQEIESLVSNEDGKISIQVPADQEYTLIASKEGFEDRVIAIPAETLGQEEDLLIVMNSIFVDSDIPDDQISTTELDPLAVTGDPWEDSVLEQNDQPDINGVALTAMPEFSETNEDDISTTELDPLAVSADGWDDSIPDSNERPELPGVALAALPNGTGQNSNEDDIPTTELDPLAVTDDGWDDSIPDSNERPELQRVALTDLPNGDQNSNEDDISTTELDPLAVSADGWDESIPDSNERPELPGVALAALPNGTDQHSDVLTTTELDPLAVSGDSWDTSTQANNKKPVLLGVALTALPNETNQNSDELTTTELDPLAVSDNGWDNSTLANTERPELQGVALKELPNGTNQNSDELTTTELDPLAVSRDSWDNSVLDDNERPELQGVALTALSNGTNQNSDKLTTTELDPLAVSGDSWDNSTLANNERPELPGVALNELPSNLDESADQTYLETRTDNNISEGINFDDIEQADNANLVTAHNEIPISFEDGLSNEKNIVDAAVLDASTNEILKSADIKLFVDSPNETLDYELNDGVLTFEALPGEDYIIVATHEDYQDEYIKLSGDELLADKEDHVTLELTKNDQLMTKNRLDNGRSTKFKAKVSDAATSELLGDAEVRLFVDGKAIESEYSKENGRTVFKSPQGKEYMMLVSREGYQDLIYHLPGNPEENMDVELALLRAVDDLGTSSPYQQLAVKGYAYDEFSGADLDDVIFKVFENGDLIETTNNLSSIEMDPQKQYQVLASKEGYHENLRTIDPSAINEGEQIDLAFAMQLEQISEVTGAPVYDAIAGEVIPITATIIDISDNQPISEAGVIVFADDLIQGKTTTWNSGIALINAVPGKDYQLLVKRDGYSDRIVNLGVINGASTDVLQIAMIPLDIQTLRQSGVDLSNANMLVMSGPAGEEQLYLSTDQDLFQYKIENGNQYLVQDNQTILLKERSRSIDSKMITKQDTDQFNLRSEDQFLYDELSADEKRTVDQIVDHLQEGSNLEEHPELSIYYNNLPEEYRKLVDNMAAYSSEKPMASSNPTIATSANFGQVLENNNILLAGTFNINNIYYDFDKAKIREDAALQLDKLVLILKGNTNIKVQMFSHTDSRGSNNYNSGLSNRRGIAAVNYLEEHGIASDRLGTKGRGESQLVNSCGNTIKCNEQAHQLNRRTEFILST